MNNPGRGRPNKRYICVETGKVFHGIKAVAEHVGTSRTTVHEHLEGRRPNIHPNYSFKRLDPKSKTPERLPLKKYRELEDQCQKDG